MKLRTLSSLIIIIGFILLVFSSCAPKPDLSKGLKVTLKLSFKDAILQAAFNPKDSLLISVLDHVHDDQNVTQQIIAFLNQYEKQYPGLNPAERFYASATDNSSTPMSKEELRNHLTKTLASKIAKMREVTSERIQAFFGVKAEDIRIDFHETNMTVYVPGVTDEKMLKPVFGNRDGIRFWATMNIEALSSYLTRVNDTLSIELKSLHKKAEKKVDSSSKLSLEELAENYEIEKDYSSPLFNVLMPAVGPDGKPTGASYIGIAAQKDTAKVNRYLNKKIVKFIIPSNVQFMWGELPGKAEDKKPLALYAILPSPTGTPLIKSTDVQDARADEQNGRVEIAMSMTPLGTIKWSQATADNVNKAIAMEIGNYVYSAPNVNERISGGRSSITGDFTLKQADELAKIIKTGGFPLQFAIVKIEPFENKD